MKQFNLEKALAGERVVSRLGLEVKIGGYFEDTEYCLVGWRRFLGEWMPGAWTKDGKAENGMDNSDIFLDPPQKTLWYALYKNSDHYRLTSLFSTKELLEKFLEPENPIQIYSIEVDE